MRSERVSSHKSLEFWVQNGYTSLMCLIRGYIVCEPNHSPNKAVYSKSIDRLESVTKVSMQLAKLKGMGVSC